MDTGSAHTVLVVLRGNSASGKSTIAREVRNRCGRGIAIIGQDVVRREILWEKDEPTSLNIGMIDVMARHALDAGMPVIIEGILSRQTYYGAMLAGLARDHRGTTSYFYLDVPFDENGASARHQAPGCRVWRGQDARLVPPDGPRAGAVGGPHPGQLFAGGIDRSGDCTVRSRANRRRDPR